MTTQPRPIGRPNELAEPLRPAADRLRERLLNGLPVTERTLLLGGVATAMLEGGEGPPVILLHSSGEFAALWMRVIPGLVTSHRVVAPDLPGHGASGVGNAPLDAEWAITWLGELIERTSQAPPVVGHALGGAIAARFAVKHGERVSRLVLVDSLGLGTFEPAPSFGLALHRFMEQPTRRTRDDLFAQCFSNLDGLRENMGERWPVIAEYALDRVRTPSMQAALGSLMPHVGIPAIPAGDLARIAAPVTLIWGRHDLQVRLQVAEEASARHGWPLHVIEDAGDDPAMERPDAFLAALRSAFEPAHSSEVTR